MSRPPWSDVQRWWRSSRPAISAAVSSTRMPAASGFASAIRPMCSGCCSASSLSSVAARPQRRTSGSCLGAHHPGGRIRAVESGAADPRRRIAARRSPSRRRQQIDALQNDSHPDQRRADCRSATDWRWPMPLEAAGRKGRRPGLPAIAPRLEPDERPSQGSSLEAELTEPRRAFSTTASRARPCWEASPSAPSSRLLSRSWPSSRCA